MSSCIHTLAAHFITLSWPLTLTSCGSVRVEILPWTYPSLMLIVQLRRSLDAESEIHTRSFILVSRLDYCNALLANLPKATTDKLQRMLNAAAAARVVAGMKKFDLGLSSHRAALARCTRVTESRTRWPSWSSAVYNALSYQRQIWYTYTWNGRSFLSTELLLYTTLLIGSQPALIFKSKLIKSEGHISVLPA